MCDTCVILCLRCGANRIPMGRICTFLNRVDFFSVSHYGKKLIMEKKIIHFKDRTTFFSH